MGARAVQWLLRCPHTPISPRGPPLVVGLKMYEDPYAGLLNNNGDQYRREPGVHGCRSGTR
jgi:hypothetical protein